MTHEYLNRKLTINRDSFTRLCADVATARATEGNDLHYSISLVLAGGTYFAEVASILFNGSKEAKTFSGSDVMVAMLMGAEKLLAPFDVDNIDGRVATAGFSLMLSLDVLEKAFGSDKDEQPAGEEAETDA